MKASGELIDFLSFFFRVKLDVFKINFPNYPDTKTVYKNLLKAIMREE